MHLGYRQLKWYSGQDPYPIRQSPLFLRSNSLSPKLEFNFFSFFSADRNPQITKKKTKPNMVLKTLQESTSSLVWNPQSSSSRINRFCTKFSHRAFDAASERTFDYLCPLKSLLGGDTQRQSLWGVSMATEKPVYVYLSIPPLPVHQSP